MDKETHVDFTYVVSIRRPYRRIRSNFAECHVVVVVVNLSGCCGRTILHIREFRLVYSPKKLLSAHSCVVHGLCAYEWKIEAINLDGLLRVKSAHRKFAIKNLLNEIFLLLLLSLSPFFFCLFCFYCVIRSVVVACFLFHFIFCRFDFCRRAMCANGRALDNHSRCYVYSPRAFELSGNKSRAIHCRMWYARAFGRHTQKSRRLRVKKKTAREHATDRQPT